MIQQRPGDLLEVLVGETYVYLVVLTKVVMFGGNIVFIFHTDGSRKTAKELKSIESGFNVCVDLIYEKRADKVSRVCRFDDFQQYFKTRFVKSKSDETLIELGLEKPGWYVGKIDNLEGGHRRYRKLPKKYFSAMNHATYPLEHLVEKIVTGYTPEDDV